MSIKFWWPLFAAGLAATAVVTPQQLIQFYSVYDVSRLSPANTSSEAYSASVALFNEVVTSAAALTPSVRHYSCAAQAVLGEFSLSSKKERFVASLQWFPFPRAFQNLGASHCGCPFSMFSHLPLHLAASILSEEGQIYDALASLKLAALYAGIIGEEPSYCADLHSEVAWLLVVRPRAPIMLVYVSSSAR